MPGMMMRPSSVRGRLLLLCVLSLAPALGAAAQTRLDPLPPADAKPAATRPAIPTPAKPDLRVAPLPGRPDEGAIPAAPVSDLPPVRIPGPATGTEPSRLVAANSTLVYAQGTAVLPSGTDAVLGDLVARLKARPTERLDMRSFATGRADRPNDGRRVALQRVRALRDRLVQLGIDPLRLNVYAEAAPADAIAGAPPADRVELVIRP